MATATAPAIEEVHYVGNFPIDQDELLVFPNVKIFWAVVSAQDFRDNLTQDDAVEDLILGESAYNTLLDEWGWDGEEMMNYVLDGQAAWLTPSGVKIRMAS